MGHRDGGNGAERWENGERDGGNGVRDGGNRLERWGESVKSSGVLLWGFFRLPK